MCRAWRRSFSSSASGPGSQLTPPATPVTGSSGRCGALRTQNPLPWPLMGPKPLGPVPSNPGMGLTSGNE